MLNRDLVGERIGAYTVVRELGRGGMGKVYLGRHEVIGRLAAIKVLAPELSFDEEAVVRILTEARLASMIEHPGIVDVYEYGRLDNGSAYLVMEYLEGESLGERLDRCRKLPREQALLITRQVAAAVGAAHHKGIVHRDLKPDNVFIVRDDEVPGGERVRVLDFGIAKLSTEFGGSAYRTRTGRLLGTPVYMSPEQCRGVGVVDSRSDIYSLACMLYELLTGRVPFELEGTGEIITAHLVEVPLPPSAHEPSVPAWLDAVILRALEKRPSARPQTMAELIAALGGRGAVEPRPPAVTAEIAADPAAQRRATTHRSSVGEVLPARRARRPWRLIAAGAALVAIAAVAIVMRPQREAPPEVLRRIAVPMPMPVRAVVVAEPAPPEPPPPSYAPLGAAFLEGAALGIGPTPASLTRRRAPPPVVPPARKPPERIDTLDPYAE